MELKKALDNSHYCNGDVIIRQCCTCNKFLDKKSEAIYNNRDTVKHVVSHGYCLEHLKEQYASMGIKYIK